MSEHVERWFKDEGDKTLRITYPLNKDSIIFDVGGYDGSWGHAMHMKYGCKVYCFEPVDASYRLAKRRENSLFRVYKYGIGGKTEQVSICVDANASSVYGVGGKREMIEIKSFAETVDTLNIKNIDLLKINIEGSEYDLLDHILQLGWQNKIIDLQIQFHKVDNQSEARRDRIRAVLGNTHELTYDYYFVWENWRKMKTVVVGDIPKN